MIITDQAKSEAIEYLLTRGVVQVEKETELRRLLYTDKPLRVKFGIDPSHYDLTIGHAVAFRKLRQFQQLGHKAVVVIGDWTARLGDPSEREDARKPLPSEQVKNYAVTYLEQFFRIVDHELTEGRWQSEWYNNFDLADTIKLQSHKTVAQMLARDDFSNRYKNGIEIYLAEFMYPLLQGYDSVALRADVEIGGTDQTFNLLVGRELQPSFGQPSQQILTVQLIVGLDGVKKMGKSLGKSLAMSTHAKDMYGKLMSLPDHAMMSYFETLTDVPQSELDEFQRQMSEGTLNPRDVKMGMAREMVSEFHHTTEALKAEESFVSQFSRRKLPTNIPDFQLKHSVDIVTLLVDAKLANSKSEARQLIQQGGVSFLPAGEADNVQRIHNTKFVVPMIDGAILKVGKLHYIQFKT